MAPANQTPVEIEKVDKAKNKVSSVGKTAEMAEQKSGKCYNCC